MKSVPVQLLFYLSGRHQRQNAAWLRTFFGIILFAMVFYSVCFHFIMLYEGRNYSWLTGLYWTLTVMSTLGFGDITFTTDLGKGFTIIVLLSGIILLLIMLPFTFIQLFYAPWLASQEKNRIPKELPPDTKDHIILTSLEPITEKLVANLNKRKIEYVLIVNDLARASQLLNAGYKVVVGEVDDPDVFHRVRVTQAAMVVATNDDLLNTSIAFTVRGITAAIPIVVSIDNQNSFDILKFPGNTHVFHYTKMLGQAMAARTIGVGGAVNVLSRFANLQIADISAAQTLLDGKTLRNAGMRQKSGASVIGFWEKGRLVLPQPDTIITKRTLLILAGTAEQLENFEKSYSLSHSELATDAPVLILGGGRVGKAVAATLKENGKSVRIVEKKAIPDNDLDFVQGDAADIKVLEKAGVNEAHTVIITTHNDSMNIYLSFYCRQLRPEMQIISRANNEHSVSKLHMAGADLVLSYASMGANAIFNILQPDELVMLSEGLNIFVQAMPVGLVGKNLIESQIREKTGCSVIALKGADGLQVNPDPTLPLKKEDELILIGMAESEQKFLENF